MTIDHGSRFLLLLALGCGTEATDADGDSTTHAEDTSASGTTGTLDGGDTTGSVVEPIADSSEGSSGAADSPILSVVLRAHAEPWPHDDDAQGQTPIDYRVGVLGLELRDTNGAFAPWSVFVLDAPLEVGHRPGDVTPLVEIVADDLPAGTYDLARVEVSHVRARVAARVHTLGTAIPGEIEVVQVLAAGVEIDGTPRAIDWWRATFHAGQLSVPSEGVGDAPWSALPDEGPYRLVIEDDRAFVEIPIDLVVAPLFLDDATLVIDAAMDASFRWQDVEQVDHAARAFDVTPPATPEPVVQAWANAYDLRLE